MAPQVEARVLELRRLRPGWGPARIAHRLARDGVDPPPSRSGIYRALRRAGLIEVAARRKRLPAYKRWERGRPMELWQMDVVGGVLLADGTECKVLTGVDDHSRFCVCAGVMVRATARPVCGFFVQAMARHGVPEEGWVVDYNTERPHQALKMATPAQRFARTATLPPQPPLDVTALDRDRSGDDWVARTVSVNGTICVSSQVFSVFKHRGGHVIDVRVREQTLEAWDGAELLKTLLRTSKGVVRKKKAEYHQMRENS
jgi:hypothetical protein